LTFLLDTDVISQLSKPQPHAAAYAWIQSQRDEDIFLSAVTLFELRFGAQEMKPGAKRNLVETFVTDAVPEKFQGRILPMTANVADLGGHLLPARSIATEAWMRWMR